MVRLSKLSTLAVSFFVAVVAAASINPLSSPGSGDVVRTGNPFLIEWKASNDDTVTLNLKRGDPTDLRYVMTIISHLPNTGIVRWTPPDHIASGKDYAIQIQDDVTGEVNYTGSFSIQQTENNQKEVRQSDGPGTSTDSSSTETEEEDMPASAASPQAASPSPIMQSRPSAVSSASASVASSGIMTNHTGLVNGSSTNLSNSSSPLYHPANLTDSLADEQSGAANIKVYTALYALLFAAVGYFA